MKIGDRGFYEKPSTLLVVDNLQVAENFYIDVLGLELLEKNPDCLKLKAGDHQVIIFQGNLTSVNYQHGYNANSTLLLTVEKLDEKIILLKSKGVVFIHQTPNQNKWGRYAAFKDPSGIVHELFELF